MFQTWPVKIRRIEPSSTPICFVGKRETIASITPGRKLKTGIDCKMSSTGIIILSALAVGCDIAVNYCKTETKSVSDYHSQQ